MSKIRELQTTVAYASILKVLQNLELTDVEKSYVFLQGAATQLAGDGITREHAIHVFKQAFDAALETEKP